MLPWFWIVRSVLLMFSSYYVWDRRGRDRMVVGCTSAHAFSAYQINPRNINDWHSSGTSRYCPPCSSCVASWTYMSFPILVDICDFRNLLHHEDIPPLCRTFFGSRMNWFSTYLRKLKKLTSCLFCCFVYRFLFMYLYKCFCFCRGHGYFFVFLETYLSWHNKK
jgi:hypothetical protein